MGFLTDLAKIVLGDLRRMQAVRKQYEHSGDEELFRAYARTSGREKRILAALIQTRLQDGRDHPDLRRAIRERRARK